MNYTVIIRPEAEIDIKEAFEWYEMRSPGLGLEFVRCIDAAFDLITENPVIFQIVYREIRRALPQRFPYGIFYTIAGDKVIVLAVLHSKEIPIH